MAKKELKKLGRHSLIYGFGEILSRLSAFLLLPVYTRYLTPSEFGVLEIFYMTSAVLSIFLGRELSHATIRFYFEFDSQEDRNRVVSTSLIFYCFISGTILGLCGIYTSQFSTLIFNTNDYSTHFLVLFGWLFISLTNEVSFAYLRAREMPVLFVISSFLELILKLSICIFLVAYQEYGVLGVLLGNLAGTLVTFFIIGGYTLYNCGFGIDFQVFKKIIKYVAPLIIVGISGTIISQADRFFLKEYVSLAAVGLYGLGMRFSSIVNFLVIQPFTKGYGPFRFSIMKQENAKEIYSKVTTYFCFIILWVSLAMTALAREVIQIMAMDAYWPAYQVIPILLISVLGHGLYYMFQIGVYIEKNTKVLSYLFIFAAFFNIFCLWLLVPRMEMVGAAIAVAATQLIIALGGLFCSNRVYPIAYEWSRLLKNLFVFGILMIFAVIAFHESPCLSALFKLPLLIAYPIVLWKIGFFTADEIKTIKRYGTKAMGKFISA